MTVLVICGLILTEVVAVQADELNAWRMFPTWCLQVILLALFAGGYYYRSLRRWMGGALRVMAEEADRDMSQGGAHDAGSELQ
jgi:uncharacterized membrane protein